MADNAGTPVAQHSCRELLRVYTIVPLVFVYEILVILKVLVRPPRTTETLLPTVAVLPPPIGTAGLLPVIVPAVRV